MGKKVAIISFVDLFPINAGNRRRIIDMVDSMKRNGYDVYYIHYNSFANTRDIRMMKNYFGHDHYFHYDKARLSWLNTFHIWMRKNMKKDVYNCVDEFIPKGFIRFIKDINKRIPFDIAVAEYVITSKCLNAFSGNTLKIIDTHDILTDRNKIFNGIGEKPMGIFLRNWQEKMGLKRADTIIAIQDQEAHIFRKWIGKGKKVIVVGDELQIHKPQLSEKKIVLFVGSGNRLNAASAQYFIREIMPYIEQEDVKIWFAGTVCKYIPSNEKYEKLGFVEDLDEIYRQARVVVNPIQGGTGLNIKTIEALANAKPLVTTTIGAKGLSGYGEFMHIADEPHRFAEFIAEILKNDKEAKLLSYNAWLFAKKYNRYCEKNLLCVLENTSTKNIHITVVTVCYNADKVIEKTILSVLHQTYKYLEYWIIDGNSSDTTIDIVKRYEGDKRIKYISEPDKGIYNAMNRGTEKANGDFLLFLNAGDELYNNNVLSSMALEIDRNNSNIVCGNWIKEYKDKTQYVHYSKNSNLKKVIAAQLYFHMANHQAILAERKLLEENPFDESYEICADFLWYLEMLKKMQKGTVKISCINMYVVNYKMDGKSADKRNANKLQDECMRALYKVYPLQGKLHEWLWKRYHDELKSRLLPCLNIAERRH